jgi:acetylornithine deacetylase/succinyl-diaminopimelate desuccinylase-like protein
MSPAVADLLVHSADERAAVEDLELGVRFLRHVAERMGGAATL